MYTLWISMHLPVLSCCGTNPSSMIWFRNINKYFLNKGLAFFSSSFGMESYPLALLAGSCSRVCSSSLEVYLAQILSSK